MSPIFATMYATAFLLKVSIITQWPLLILTLVALIPGAAYVSVINDLTDLKDDCASGKTNRLEGRSRIFIALTLACCIVPGVLVSVYWRGETLLLGLYLANWTIFSLYSIPPIRLKNRGLPGVLADASGAHLLPTLLVVCLVFRQNKTPIDLVWFTSVAIWSLSYGLRGILWHQFSDLENDRRAGVRTFALRHDLPLLHRIGKFIVFPAELTALSIMLWRAGSRVAIGLLLFYLLLELWRTITWETSLTVVTPKPQSRIVIHEYYEVFYPLAFLISSSLKHPLDAIAIILHLVLFPRRAVRSLQEIIKLAKE